MHASRIGLLGLLLACAALAWGAPYIGYVYPAGGQQGTVLRVTVAGQRMRGIRNIVFSGAGVRATLVEFTPAGGPLNALQREVLRKRIMDIITERMPAAQRPAPPAANPASPEKPLPEVKLPDLPDLQDLDKKTNPELRKLIDKYVSRQKQTKPPIAEEAVLEVTIAADAAPGDREIRLQTPDGLSNPLVFQVGALPEIREKDREDIDAVAPPPAEAPVVLNGQVMPGEVDRFAMKLRAGQRLYLTAYARRLIPYMADAVPGWMQAVLTLYDATGKELAYADDTDIDPDPSFFVQVPQDGDYTLAIRDAIYRGREDFVYRVIIRPRAATDRLYTFANLARVPANATTVAWNPLLPWVDSRLPEVRETDPNNTFSAAQKIAVPQLVKGSISQPGDLDVFQFSGKAGDTVVAEVYARRLGSSMDALLRVYDTAGRVLAWNDDTKSEEMGLITHHADAYLTVKLPADGMYAVQVSDIQRHGGEAYGYCLRVGPPQGDFALCMTPSSLALPAGGTATFTVYAFRKDGWDGEIEVAVQGTDGFTLTNTKIPAGKAQATVTLKAPAKRFDGPLALTLTGQATIGGQALIRPVVPAERKMQAFAYYHLVPAQQLLVWVQRR